jgi:hypothetical protein
VIWPQESGVYGGLEFVPTCSGDLEGMVDFLVYLLRDSEFRMLCSNVVSSVVPVYRFKPYLFCANLSSNPFTLVGAEQ